MCGNSTITDEALSFILFLHLSKMYCNPTLDDVRRIREALDMSPETPAVPETARKLTWDKANDIEQILLDVENTISRLKLSWFYSGEIYCGEV